jgi:hypothetical protein
MWKRAVGAGVGVLLLFGAIWFCGSLWPSSAAYMVVTAAQDQQRLQLAVARPGLFVDVHVPEGASVTAATAGGRPAGLLPPWPRAGERRRVLAFWRRPVTLTLAEGPGPFRLTGQVVPVAGQAPSVLLPTGWQQVGGYVGQFTLVAAGPIQVAVPTGTPDPAAAAERVRKLYDAAAQMMQVAPPHEALVVALTGPEPDAAARAVMALWLPEPRGEVAWWSRGAAAFFGMRLLDQTNLWTKAEQARWQKARQTERDFVLVQWLDASLRIVTGRQDAADQVLRTALGAGTNAEVIAAVKAVGGLTTADHLYRMLRGREPLPSTQL